MEIEKVIRIVATFIAVAAFGIFVATRLMFPDSSSLMHAPIAIILLVSLGGVWRKTEKNTTQDK